MHIFVSHSNKPNDKYATQKLVDYLSSKHIFCWVDFNGIKSGYWAEQISKAMNTASYFIIVGSKNFFESDECINELKIIAKSSRREKVMPFFLDRYYLENEEVRNKLSYQVDSLEGVFIDNFKTLDEACEALYVKLPKDLTILDCNPKDFVFKEDMCSLVKYQGNEEAVILPDMVTTICDRAFLNNQKIQKITIPKSVKTIDDCAFADCDNLCFVEGMDGIIDCAHNIVGKKEIPVVEVQDGIKYFGKVALGVTDKDMQTIQIRQGTRAIARSAFKEMFSLEEVILPDSLVYIGAFAFKDCEQLKTINIRDDIGIGKKAFEGCDNIRIKEEL